MLKKEGKPFDEEECENHANEMQSRRLELIRDEMQSVPGGRLDACLAVSLGASNTTRLERRSKITDGYPQMMMIPSPSLLEQLHTASTLIACAFYTYGRKLRALVRTTTIAITPQARRVYCTSESARPPSCRSGSLHSYTLA